MTTEAERDCKHSSPRRSRSMSDKEFQNSKHSSKGAVKLLVCPDCGTDQVIVYEKHAVMANTYEHYCHSVKAHDDDAEALCLKCEWTGKREDLGEQT